MTSPYAVPLDALEDETHVRVEDMVTEQPEPPAESPISPQELDRQRLLGITSAGVLKA